MSKGKKALLFYGASETDADIYYFTSMYVPDPFIAIQSGRKKIAVLDQLEFARGQKELDFDEILLRESLIGVIKKEKKQNVVRASDIILYLAKKYHVLLTSLPGLHHLCYFQRLRGVLLP